MPRPSVISRIAAEMSSFSSRSSVSTPCFRASASRSPTMSTPITRAPW
ncbi:MAG TPA: hypothetical protein VNB59_06320 [Solirubrobacterales bacterium]|nr:hypothetical protein [Solirubrobacterales bacterium]